MEIAFDSVQKQVGMYLTGIKGENYFNPRHSVIRVESPFDKTVYFDFKLAPTYFPPNPKSHKALLITQFQQLSSTGLSSERLTLHPGIENEAGALATLPLGIVYLIDVNQRLYTADNQSGSTGFSISNTNVFDADKVKTAITPPLAKGYTSNSNDNDDANEIGLFMNNDSIMMRSRGAQLTLGNEGVHIGGNVFWESTTHSKEIMQDNFIHQLVPSTIPTAGVAIPQFPNFGMIAQIAATANKFISVVGTAKNIIGSI